MHRKPDSWHGMADGGGGASWRLVEELSQVGGGPMLSGSVFLWSEGSCHWEEQRLPRAESAYQRWPEMRSHLVESVSSSVQ